VNWLKRTSLWDLLKRPYKRDILPKPRMDCVVQTYKDHWKVELITKRNDK